MITSGIISFVGVTCGGHLAFSKRLAASTGWKATVTPHPAGCPLLESPGWT